MQYGVIAYLYIIYHLSLRLALELYLTYFSISLCVIVFVSYLCRHFKLVFFSKVFHSRLNDLFAVRINLTRAAKKPVVL